MSRSIFLTFLLIYFTFCLPGHVHSQYPVHAMGAGAGTTLVHYRDLFHSPVTYTGFSWLTAFRYSKTRSRYSSRVLSDFHVQDIEPDLDNDSRSRFMRAEIDYLYLRNILSGSDKWQAGGHIRSNMITSNHHSWPNNNFSYIFLGSAGICGAYNSKMPVAGKKATLSILLRTDLIAYVLKPSLASEVPTEAFRRDEFWLTEQLASGRITGPGRYKRISGNVSLLRPVSAGWSLGLEYQWDMFSCNADNAQSFAMHGFHVNIHYHFSKRKGK